MSAPIFRDISAAWPIAIKRSKTANLAPGGFSSFWENDFFVRLSKKVPWEKILREVQAVLPNADPAEISEVFSYALSKQFESDLKDESERIEFRDSLFIELEKFIPLDDKDTELVEEAKALLQFPGYCLVAWSDYEIGDLSGTDCGDPAIMKETLIALESYEKNDEDDGDHSDRIPKGSLTAEDISSIRSAVSFGRLEAAWNLTVASDYPALIFPRLTMASYWVPRVLKMLKDHLRIERAERINKINHLAYSLRNHFEKDLQLLDEALGISERSIMETGYVLFLKKEYYNRIHEAEIEKLGARIKNNKDAVSFAVAERLIQTHPDMKKILQDVFTVLEEMHPVGEEEKRLLEDARKSVNDAKSETERKNGLIMNKVNVDPAPAA